MVLRDEAQPERAGYVRNEEEEDEDAALVLEAVVEIDAGENGDSNEDAIRDLIQYKLCYLVIESGG